MPKTSLHDDLRFASCALSAQTSSQPDPLTTTLLTTTFLHEKACPPRLHLSPFHFRPNILLGSIDYGMKPENYDDFTSAMGEEFAAALSSVSDDICGVDVYTVFTRVFSSDFSPEFLASLSSEQIERLCAEFANYLEVADAIVTRDHITRAISRTLVRWPVDSGNKRPHA